MKKSPFALFDAATGAKMRSLIRVSAVFVAAFWVTISAQQLAAVVAMLEGVMAVLIASPIGDAPPPAPPAE